MFSAGFDILVGIFIFRRDNQGRIAVYLNFPLYISTILLECGSESLLSKERNNTKGGL